MANSAADRSVRVALAVVGVFFLLLWLGVGVICLPRTTANDENTLFFPTPRAYLPIAFSPHDAMGSSLRRVLQAQPTRHNCQSV
jgi:hypothetical protein